MIKINSISFKVTAFLIVLFIITFAVVGYVIVNREIETRKSSMLSESRSFSYLSVENIMKNYMIYYESGFYKYRELVGIVMALNPNLDKIQILDYDGMILFDSDEIKEGKYQGKLERVLNDENIISRIRKLEPSVGNTALGGKEYMDIIQPYIEEWGRHQYSVRYYFSYKILQNDIATIITEIMAGLIASFVVVTVSFYIFTRKVIIKPLIKIASGFTSLRLGKLEKIDIKSKDEIGYVAANFNSTAEELYKSRIAIEEHSKTLEKDVEERTRQLEGKVSQLERFSKLVIGRELKMVEMKKKLKEMEDKMKSNGQK
ncbi:MAG: hypothetical protein V1648_02825 [Candidatus Aenigmatarchaeota archaeon]